jgi:uncharacterized protein (DUF1800 family)
MASNPKADAALALHRFGFGPAGNTIANIASDPRGALLADLDRPNAGQVAANFLPGSADAARQIFDFQAERRAQQKLEQRAKKVADARGSTPDMAGENPAMGTDAKPDIPPKENAQAKGPLPLPRQIFLAEAQARFDAATGAEIGFAERLVWFWSNHFCVSAAKDLGMSGGYEREAIRPNILGRFADLLLAAESHPAMLFFLDNAQSIGPNSIAGLNQDKGLNENLAREIMELHTLGVRAGYSQDDVTRFAKILTGWTFIPLRGDPDRGGEFVFNRRMHEPGDQAVLGKRYPASGAEQGKAVLADLARHPATATHIATKLASYFVADHPPQPLVDRLAKAFRDSDGDLKEVSKALIAAPESWSTSRVKLKTPSLWLASTLRTTRVAVPLPRILGAQDQLGEPLWRPAAPNGFSNEEAAWLDGLSRRLDIANEFARRVPQDVDPRALLDSAFGGLVSEDTRNTIARAESRQQAMAMLMMSPEFMRS